MAKEPRSDISTIDYTMCTCITSFQSTQKDTIFIVRVVDIVSQLPDILAYFH